MLKTIAIIQARMGSTRLPGKVLMDICGKTMLARVVDRIKLIKEIDDFVIATSINGKDQEIVDVCQKMGINCFRGSENDVLTRYLKAAQLYNADTIVRFCCDSPLLDPQVADQVISFFKSNKDGVDFCYNSDPASYPMGLDTQVFSFKALEKTALEAKQKYERSHVTVYMYENPNKFVIRNIKNDTNESHHRWVVDTQEDLNFMCVVYDRLKDFHGMFFWKDVINLIENDPSVSKINYYITKKNVTLG